MCTRRQPIPNYDICQAPSSSSFMDVTGSSEAEQKKKGHRDQYFVNKTLDEEEEKKNYCYYKKKWLS